MTIYLERPLPTASSVPDFEERNASYQNLLLHRIGVYHDVSHETVPRELLPPAVAPNGAMAGPLALTNSWEHDFNLTRLRPPGFVGQARQSR